MNQPRESDLERMSNTAASNPVFESLGEEFCWHARNFAAMYGAECVGVFHILLAAAEVTPVELHGYSELTPASLSEKIPITADISDGYAGSLPKTLTPSAQELIAKVASFASRTSRAPTLRDIWVALSSDESATVRLLFKDVGIHPIELYRRVSGS